VREQRTDTIWRILGEHDPRAAVTAVAIAPGRVASGGREGTAKLWRVVATGDAEATDAPPPVSGIAFADEDGNSGQPLAPLVLLAQASHQDVVTGVVLDDASTMVTSCLDGGVRAWRCDNTKKSEEAPHDLHLVSTVDLESPVTSLAAVPEEARVGPLENAAVVAGTYSGWLSAISVQGEVLSRWRAHVENEGIALPPAVRSLHISAPGALGESSYPTVFAGDGTGNIVAWSRPSNLDYERAVGDDSWALCRYFKGHVGAVVALTHERELDMLVSGAWDGTVRVWDVMAGESLYAIGGHTAYLGSVGLVGDTIVSDGCNDVVAAHKISE